MRQMQRESEIQPILLADGTPALVPEIAQVFKAQGCFDAVEPL